MLAHADIDDTGPAPGAGRDERTCVVTRAVKPVDELIRFVVAPDGAVVPDLNGACPGRGVWVTATRAAVDEAVQAQGFCARLQARGARRADLGEQVERQLERAALDALGIVHKAGRVAIGFARTETALAAGPVAAVLQARTGPPTGPQDRRRPSSGARRTEIRAKSRSSRRLRRRNWIWHWGGQMWYMLPCSPAQRATGSSRAARASNATGPLIRTDVARDSAWLNGFGDVDESRTFRNGCECRLIRKAPGEKTLSVSRPRR